MALRLFQSGIKSRNKVLINECCLREIMGTSYDYDEKKPHPAI